MTPQRWLPCVQILLSTSACVVYLCAGDWRKAIYWRAAAVITASVTF